MRIGQVVKILSHRPFAGKKGCSQLVFVYRCGQAGQLAGEAGQGIELGLTEKQLFRLCRHEGSAFLEECWVEGRHFFGVYLEIYTKSSIPCLLRMQQRLLGILCCATTADGPGPVSRSRIVF